MLIISDITSWFLQYSVWALITLDLVDISSIVKIHTWLQFIPALLERDSRFHCQCFICINTRAFISFRIHSHTADCLLRCHTHIVSSLVVLLLILCSTLTMHYVGLRVASVSRVAIHFTRKSCSSCIWKTPDTMFSVLYIPVFHLNPSPNLPQKAKTFRCEPWDRNWCSETLLLYPISIQRHLSSYNSTILSFLEWNRRNKSIRTMQQLAKQCCLSAHRGSLQYLHYFPRLCHLRAERSS